MTTPTTDQCHQNALIKDNGITMAHVLIIFMTIENLSSSSAVMIGASVGRGDMKRVKSDARTLVVIDLLIGVALGVALFVLRKPLLTFYNLIRL